MSFENISKGEARVLLDSGMCYVETDDNDICMTSVVRSNNSENDAEFIAFAFNLQQRLDIGCYEEVIKALESCMSELYTIHSQYGDKQNALDNSVALRESEQILNKAKK